MNLSAEKIAQIIKNNSPEDEYGCQPLKDVAYSWIDELARYSDICITLDNRNDMIECAIDALNSIKT